MGKLIASLTRHNLETELFQQHFSLYQSSLALFVGVSHVTFARQRQVGNGLLGLLRSSACAFNACPSVCLYSIELTSLGIHPCTWHTRCSLGNSSFFPKCGTARFGSHTCRAHNTCSTPNLFSWCKPECRSSCHGMSGRSNSSSIRCSSCGVTEILKTIQELFRRWVGMIRSLMTKRRRTLGVATALFNFGMTARSVKGDSRMVTETRRSEHKSALGMPCEKSYRACPVSTC